jgi:PAS domain S-box-containing protein
MNEQFELRSPEFLAGGGEMGGRMRTHDWSRSPLGPTAAWAQPLRTLVGVMLGSNHPMFVAWGPEQALLYNDGYARIMGRKHPGALGRPFAEVWHEILPEVGPIMRRAYAGEPTHMDDLMLVMERHGYREETHFSLSYTPVRDESGRVAGVFCPCTEITAQVFADRRQAFRLGLEEHLRGLADPQEIMAKATELLGRHLGAGQVAYAEIDETGAFATIERDWNDGSIPSVVGRHRLDAFGSGLIGGLRRGETAAIADVAADLRTASPEALSSFDQVSVRGLLDVPLVKDGRLVAILAVHSRTPRPWSPHEAALVADVAERTWAVVERARAEAALRESEQRFRVLVESMTEGVSLSDERGVIVYTNPAEDRMFGYAPGELIGQSVTVQNAYPPEESTRIVAAVIAELRASGSWDGEWLNRRKDGAEFVTASRITAVELRGQPHWLCVQRDVTEARRAEERIRFQAHLLDAVEEAVIATDLEGRVFFWNRFAEKLYGWSAQEAHGRPILELTSGSDPAKAQVTLAHVVQGGSWSGEFTGRRRDGSTFPGFVTDSPVLDETGKLIGVIGISYDITRRKQWEEHQQLLIHELNHRVKNTLATVQSVAAQTLRNAATPDEARTALEGRLMALSRAHDVLTRENWEGASLYQVVAQAVAPYSSEGEDRLHLRGPHIRLQPRLALALAMVLQELATNAVKYGALSNETGQITIAWALERDEGPDRIRLVWEETGGPPVVPPARRGFGSRLIERSVTQDLGGSATLEFRPSGLRCIVDAPIG